MNSSDMYLKVSKNIFDCLDSANKEEYNKNELNDNLFLQLSFLTKFVSGKNIQENPNFNFFVSKKNSIITKQIDKNIEKQENIIEDLNEIELNDDNDKKIETDENTENNNGRFENITGDIDDEFNLESRQSVSTYRENNLDQSNTFSQIPDKNNTFDLGSNLGDCSTIFKDNQSFYNEMDDSFFGNKVSNKQSRLST